MNWTSQQILSLSSDTGSISAGKGLSNGKKLYHLGKAEDYLWGECQGSGAEMYQISIDLADGATKCNCMAYKRGKVPCKHGIGMFLYYASTPDSFPTADAPAYASEWVNKRRNKAETAAKPKTDEELVKAAKQKEKTQSKRLSVAQEGISEAITWLQDIMRTGIAQQEQLQGSFGNAQKGWLENAKASGFANMVRDLQETLGEPSNPNWASPFFKKMGQLYFALRTFQQVENFSPEFQQEMKSLAGFSVKAEDIIATEKGVQDEWIVVGRTFVEDDERNLKTRFMWIQGKNTAKKALIIETAFGGANYKEAYTVGVCYKGELVFYPGTSLQRAANKNAKPQSQRTNPNFATIEENFQEFATLLTANPWLNKNLFLIKQAQLLQIAKKWYIADQNGEMLPIKTQTDALYTLLAVTGNRPFDFAGEWNVENNVLIPLSIWTENAVIPLGL